MGEPGQVFGGSPQAQVQMDGEHMEKRVKVALGLGTVVALCWSDHKEPIHNCSVGHVDMPIAIKRTHSHCRKKSLSSMEIHVNDLVTAVKTICRHIKPLHRKQLQSMTVEDYPQRIIKIAKLENLIL